MDPSGRFRHHDNNNDNNNNNNKQKREERGEKTKEREWKANILSLSKSTCTKTIIASISSRENDSCTFASSTLPSLEESTVDNDDANVCVYEAPECWWENMEDLTQCAGHEEMLEESAWQADLAEQMAQDMLLVLQQSRVAVNSVSLGVTAQSAPQGSCRITLDTIDEGNQNSNDVSPRFIADDQSIDVTLTDKDDMSCENAINESILQANFAEQTAEEMKQVMTWWSDGQSPEQTITVTQKDSLPKNSLVIASPDVEEFFSPAILHPPTVVQLMTPKLLLDNYICSSPQSTYSTSCTSPSSSSCMEKAQEQAIQVDAQLEHAKDMRQQVLDLTEKENAVKPDAIVIHWDTSTIRGGAPDGTQLLWGLWTGRIRRWLLHILAQWVWSLMSLDMQLVWVWLAQRPAATKWMIRILFLLSFFPLHQLVYSKGNTSTVMNIADYKVFFKEDFFYFPVHNAMYSWLYHECSYFGFGEVAMEAILL